MTHLENRVWKLMLITRMNKYYHQEMSRRLRLIGMFINGVSIAALTFSGANLAPQVSLPSWFLAPLVLLSIVAQIISVTFDLTSAISTHQVLFEGFNSLEAKTAALDSRLERGESVEGAGIVADALDGEFFALEGRQPPPRRRLLDRFNAQVRQEFGVQ